MSRVYNFSAGPAVLPEEVLREAADEMLDYQGTGMSVMEMSHRSKVYEEIIRDNIENVIKVCSNIKGEIVLVVEGSVNYDDTKNYEEVINYIKKINLDNATILVKASRKMNLDKIVDYILEY